ncbi:MAG: sigma-70 family RNA polymerase sigma factor [Elusimicrobiales bacterium]|nr:sigma-70 family RNA polymerase sigma factor [Elusimicrobiales bacterium]
MKRKKNMKFKKEAGDKVLSSKLPYGENEDTSINSTEIESQQTNQENSEEKNTSQSISALSTDSTKQYIKAISQIDTKISREEFHQLWLRVKRGDRRAKDRILQVNLKLVIPIAKKYLYGGCDLMDLIEEGNLGLLHAIDKFDPKKGYRFSTYASYWIEQYIRRYVEEQSKTIRVPPHAWTALRKWLRQWDLLHGKLGRDPTLTEMAKEMHWNANQIRTVLNAYEVVKGSTSLENPVYNEDHDEDTLGQMIEDNKQSSPEDPISILKMHDELKNALSQIGDRERMILEMRYGLAGTNPMTLQEIGDKIKLSRERVRQLEERAILRLRRVAANMGLIEMKFKTTPNLKPGWNNPKQYTDILGNPLKKEKK